MGDVAWFNITFKKSDLERVNNALKDEEWNDDIWEDDHPSGKPITMTATIYEANYGGTAITDALIAENISFDACYGSGGSYGPGALVHIEGEQAEVSTDIEGTPVVIYERDGISERDEKHVKKYYALLKKVEKYFED